MADPSTAVTIAAGTVFTEITVDTELPSGSNDDQNLRIDGATVTLVGSHVFRNVELLNGAVLTHRETDLTTEFNLDLSVWTLTIDETSAIDVSGRGYLGGQGLLEPGRTAGNALGSDPGDGGSHGAWAGTTSARRGVPGDVYGDLTEPLTLGGGGGANTGSAAPGGDGGGLILLGATNLVVDGAIRADGVPSTVGGRQGMGAGGGVNLRTRTLSGIGSVEADGGTLNGSNNTGGGGGRIALRFLDIVTYDEAGITASGGDGAFGDGADGTIFLLEEGAATGQLVINGNGPGSPLTQLLIPPGASFESIVLQNGANVVATGQITLADSLVLRGGSTLTHPDADESCLVIDAADVEIEAGSAIDVSGRGHPGGATLGEPGRTLGDQAGSDPGEGGSYGGRGGDDVALVGRPGLVFGDPRRPMALGSGGGANLTNTSPGGAGGGCVRITTTGSVEVDGAIRANGAASPVGGRQGMGSGGSIWITTSRLSGTGAIAADGGTLNGSNNTGGGGGRVALYVDFVDPLADLADLRSVTASGGDGAFGDGAPGTVYVERSGQGEGDLVFDAVRASFWAPESWLPEIGPGVAASVTASSLTLDGGRDVLPGGLVGLRLNPDLAQAESFEIVANTATELTVATPNENGIAFASVASAGATYAGAWRFGSVTLQGGVFASVADPLVIDRSLEVTEQSVLSHPPATLAYEPALDLVADSVEVDATSRIDVSARGYLGGQVLGEGGRSVGNVPTGPPGDGAATAASAATTSSWPASRCRPTAA